MGKAIIFIHGFGGFADIWRWQKEYFSVGNSVLSIDLPGHGVRPWNGESLEDMARIVHQECQGAGIQSADIVASSFGGLVALKVCELFPDLVHRAVYAGALPRFTAVEGFPAGLDPERIRKLAGQFQGNVGTVLDMFFRSLFTRKEKERPRYFQVKEIRSSAPLPQREALFGVLDMLEKDDLRPQLAALDKPALFIFGDTDYICPLAVVEPLRQLCPSAQIEVLKDVGHFPFLSIPEVFNRRVERFLQ